MSTISQQKRIVITLVTFFIIIVSLSTYFILTYIHKNTLKRIETTLQVVADMSVKTSKSLLNKRLTDSNQLSKNQDVINLTNALILEQQQNRLSPQSESVQKLRAIIIPQLREFDEIGFGIITKNKRIIAGLRDNSIGQNLDSIVENVFQDRINAVFEGESIIIPPIFIGFDENEIENANSRISTLMFAATPIINEHNNIIAAFFLSFNPMVHFSAITEMANLGDTGESYVFDKDAVLISKTRFYNNTTLIDNSANLNDTNVKHIRIFDPEKVNAIRASNANKLPLTYMAEKATSKQNGVNMSGYNNYRGEKVFGAWRWIDSLGIGIAVELTEEEAMQFFQLIQKVTLSIVLTCFTLMLIMLRIIYRLQKTSHLKLKNANEKLEDRVNKRTAELTKAQDDLLHLNKELASLAITDGLTLLPNRRFFDSQLESEWHRCLRDDKSLAIILFDIDHFKAYNDHYGHVAGDSCLKKIGKMLIEQTFAKRPSDVIARYGGEEFVVLLSNASIEYTKQVADNICKHVKSLAITHDKTSLADKVVTVSVGACITSELDTITTSELIEYADQALYQAKSNGRNNSVEVMLDKNKTLIPI